MIIRSKAPLRISFAGGGTDVEPYVSEQGGVVLSTTIDKYAYGSMRFRDDRQITLLLCYTGQTRLSARIIETQVKRYVERRQDVLRAMDELKHIAVALKNALLQGHLGDFGMLLHEAWVNKKCATRARTHRRGGPSGA